MPLKDIEIPTKDVPVGTSSFSVSPITIERLTLLLQDYSVELEKIFVEFQSNENVDFSTLIAHSGGFCARLIAICAGEEDQIEKVSKLPIPVQVEALQSIFDVSFGAYGGVKKFCSLLVGVMQGAVQTVDEIKSQVN
ncbi:MAG: hypothetical protein K6L81_01960 [Agarilytica sp.]